LLKRKIYQQKREKEEAKNCPQTKQQETTRLKRHSRKRYLSVTKNKQAGWTNLLRKKDID